MNDNDVKTDSTLAKDAPDRPSADVPASDPAMPGLLAVPDDAIIIVPVRNFVLFPGIVMPLSIGRPASIAAAQAAVRAESAIGVLTQRNPELAEPGPADMNAMGTAAAILRYVTSADGEHHLIVQGQQRFRVIGYLDGWPYMVARIERIDEPETAGTEIEARVLHLRQLAIESLELLPQAPAELATMIQGITSGALLADTVAAYLDLTTAQKQEILETTALQARLDKVSQLLAQRLEVLRLSREIGRDVEESLGGRQREVLLREQLAAIQRQLGEGGDKSAEIAELAEAITKAQMPPEVEAQAQKELRRLERMPEAATEHAMVRTYLDWLIELPWALPEESAIDIARARAILDEDHFDLEKIKRRIAEYLAVRKLAPHGKAPILCFVGPPGVGKTSLGQSIARAMDRAF
ncbi:MAG TPA: LON peptidase substrate-binding domain-containing protein, partial [Polymorphobacter sp.]|nr:LON peptidase substrate-binding domain-containing protein [Polymorphobacter sp.]